MDSGPDYIKHIYWITKAEEHRLREDMITREINVTSAKGIPCRALNEKIELAIVEPDDWNKV